MHKLSSSIGSYTKLEQIKLKASVNGKCIATDDIIVPIANHKYLTPNLCSFLQKNKRRQNREDISCAKLAPCFQANQTVLDYFAQAYNGLVQRGPNTGTRAACGPRTVFVRPANAFCMPYITQSHKYIVLATQPLQVTHHWSAGQYVTIRG